MTPSLEERAERALRADDVDTERLAGLAGYDSARVDPDACAPSDPVQKLADSLQSLLLPWSDEELEAAKEPWPHVFQHLHTGLFPAGEVSIVAAAGREGKTTVKVGVATALVTAHSLGGLYPQEGRTVVIYSAEDDRAQYARKIAAQVSVANSARHASLIKTRILCPNLDDAGVAAAKSLVGVAMGQPFQGVAVDAIIEALSPMLQAEHPLGMVIFETASTLSDAEEDNAGFRVLILALKRIARALGVAVVLSHHVSQASLANLSDLNVSTTDIRGATALVNNARQTALLVNLGSDADPFPETDARTVLRTLACPSTTARVTALISLDSSKGITPPPIFFEWIDTDWGPAAVEVEVPDHLKGRPWRKVHEMLRAERAERRDQAKAEKSSAVVSGRLQRVLDAVAKLERMDPHKPVTARRVRELVGMSAAVVGQALGQAVSESHLIATPVTVQNNETVAYRLPGRGFGGTDQSHGEE